MTDLFQGTATRVCTLSQLGRGNNYHYTVTSVVGAKHSHQKMEFFVKTNRVNASPSYYEESPRSSGSARERSYRGSASCKMEAEPPQFVAPQRNATRGRIELKSRTSTNSNASFKALACSALPQSAPVLGLVKYVCCLG